MSGTRKAYSVLGAILLAEIALQFYFIATAALNVWGAPDSAGAVYSAFKSADPFASLHAINGTIVIPITALAMLVLAFVAGLPRRDKGQTGALVGLIVLQFILGAIGTAGNTAAAVIGGLHGLNAIAIVGAAGSLVYRTWAFRGTPAPAT